jgi:hypothetical protein
MNRIFHYYHTGTLRSDLHDGFAAVVSFRKREQSPAALLAVLFSSSFKIRIL